MRIIDPPVRFWPILVVIVSFIARCAFAQEWQTSIVTDPSISRRCKQIIKNRDEKIQVKQKLKMLILRNSKLVKITPPNKVTTKNKLEKNRKRLDHELRLVELIIDRLSEDGIKKGCPGIIL